MRRTKPRTAAGRCGVRIGWHADGGRRHVPGGRTRSWILVKHAFQHPPFRGSPTLAFPQESPSTFVDVNKPPAGAHSVSLPANPIMAASRSPRAPPAGVARRGLQAAAPAAAACSYRLRQSDAAYGRQLPRQPPATCGKTDLPAATRAIRERQRPLRAAARHALPAMTGIRPARLIGGSCLLRAAAGSRCNWLPRRTWHGARCTQPNTAHGHSSQQLTKERR